MASLSPRSIAPTSLDAPVLRDSVARHRARLLARLEQGEDGLALGEANARFLNACFKLRFEGAARSAGLPGGVTLAKAGSFGRGAVALRSDADVVIVVDSGVVDARSASELASALLYPLWDATLAVGHQVLSSKDAVALAQRDLAMATELLDLRLLAGDPAPLEQLLAQTRKGIFAEDNIDNFIDRLDAEASARHERFGGSLFLLEPDVKNGAGGLRDLDGARWAARARYWIGEQPSEGPLRAWGELVRLGVLLSREAREIAEAEEFLWRIRNRLHARAGRKSDRLGFEDQEALGVTMGFGDHRTQAAERLMQAFYTHARVVTSARSNLLERLRPPRKRTRPAPPVDLGGGVQLFDGQVTIADSGALESDPPLALRVFMACVRHNAPVLPRARDVVARAVADPSWCGRLRASPEAATLFVELVCTMPETRTRRGSVLGELHDVGLLLAMIPEFGPVVGRGHHDVYHVYTVDVHSVAAVDRLRKLARGELAHEFPLASRLAAEIARPRPLMLATLLHDIGKGYPDADGSQKNHSKAGEILCRSILPRLGFTDEEIEETCHLVMHHLVMYQVATRRDIDDGATIEEFCRSVRGHEGLRNLYLLTVADVGTTSPTAMTSWKARMLEELYFASEGYLTGHAPQADRERIRRVREAARALWEGPKSAIDDLLSCLPERYLLANRAESIVQHAHVVHDRGRRGSCVARVPSRHPEAAELCIVADDRPGLLASISAALAASRLEVLTAEVYSHPVGAEREALDLFWVRDRDGGTGGVEAALPRLARDLEDVCTGRVAPADLLRLRTGSSSPWRERPSPAVATEILFDDRASTRHTIIEVFAKDRPGLLYTLAEALHELGLQIALSKINTEGTRIADVFYVSELDGKKVAPGARHDAIRDALLRAVG
ncbi:MAG TPA: [protein-PII] uridylyltransferase [Polyangiaceae bacterium]|nr:[protein-PII] uridylyltransferase [Polyangiaceae bacterium]